MVALRLKIRGNFRIFYWVINGIIVIKIVALNLGANKRNDVMKCPTRHIPNQQDIRFSRHFAGTPLTVTPAGTSFVTTAPAPIMA